MKPSNYLLFGSLAINLIIILLWCPLHSFFPCGANSDTNPASAPIQVTTTLQYDSTEVELTEVSDIKQTSQWPPSYVIGLETEAEALRKQTRASDLTETLLKAELHRLASENSNTDSAYRALRSFVETLTAEDTAAIVYKALFEKHTDTRTHRKDSIAEVTVKSILYQNRITQATAIFKNLAPVASTTVNSYYSDRFMVFPGLQFALMGNADWGNLQPLAGIDLSFKFKSNTMVSPGYMVGANTQLITLRVNQLLRFQKLRDAIENGKIKRAVKKAALINSVIN